MSTEAQFKVYMSERDKKKLQRAAKKDGRSLSSWVARVALEAAKEQAK